MSFSGIERLLGVGMALAGAIVLTVATTASGEAGTRRKAAVTKAYAQETFVPQQKEQKPFRLRYFGGPKSMMYGE